MRRRAVTLMIYQASCGTEWVESSAGEISTVSVMNGRMTCPLQVQLTRRTLLSVDIRRIHTMITESSSDADRPRWSARSVTGAPTTDDDRS